MLSLAAPGALHCSDSAPPFDTCAAARARAWSCRERERRTSAARMFKPAAAGGAASAQEQLARSLKVSAVRVRGFRSPLLAAPATSHSCWRSEKHAGEKRLQKPGQGSATEALHAEAQELRASTFALNSPRE